MEIEIYSDVVCPWCYLGKARLDAALASYDGEVILRWRAFQLDPGAPREGRPLHGWLARRFGSEERARAAVAQATSAAESEGLRFDFDRAQWANTFDTHRLLWFADQPEAVFSGATADTQPGLAESLYRAHLVDGLDVSAHDVLVTLAERIGLEPGRVRGLLASTEGTADVRAQIARAHDIGIRSVPTFVFAGRFAVTGARDAATLRSVIDEVARRDGVAAMDDRLVPGQRSAPSNEDDSRVG